MVAPVPTLGYPSKTAAIVGLRAQGKSTAACRRAWRIDWISVVIWFPIPVLTVSLWWHVVSLIVTAFSNG